MPRAWFLRLTRSKRRCHTPSFDQRMNGWAAIHQGPSSEGTERHFAPLRCRQKMAYIVRRRFFGGVFPLGRMSLISGSQKDQL